MSIEHSETASAKARSIVAGWFAERGWTAFDFQEEVWAAYSAGESGLIHAATGTGKTYAAWLGPLMEWLEENADAKVPLSKTGRAKRAEAPPLRILWITPLRALAADTLNALELPLKELSIPWTLEQRTGDTSSAVRARQNLRFPTALVTTPESLSLFLTRPDAAERFADLRGVVVDEWHELLASKRGVQTELALARLRKWRPNLRVWGLSATLGNLDVALQALLGAGRHGRTVRGSIAKTVRIDSVLPETVERFPWAGHLGLNLVERAVEAIDEGKTALVFTNTRSQTEMWYRGLLKARPDWAGIIALHHGSLDRSVRDWVEDGLRAGTLRCVVCTSSLDLGVDFSPVDRVVQVGSPKGIARLLQRAGRSGHRPGVPSRITFVPTHALELVEVAAVRAAAESGKIEGRAPFEKPLDVLAQHAVTVAIGGGFRADELFREVRQSYAYRDLSAEEWTWVLDFVVRGGATLRAYPEYRRVVEAEGVYTVPDPKVARRHRMAVGTIVSDADVEVRFMKGARLGRVEESFIARLKKGDRFVFAGRVLELVRVRDMVAWVRLSRKSLGAVPRWAGGRMPLSSELAGSVRILLDDARRGIYASEEMSAVRPILELQGRLSRIPAPNELLVERVSTKEGHHLFFYPFEGRLVHEGLAAVLAYRFSRRTPASFSLAYNDYGLELLCDKPIPLDEALRDGLLSPVGLIDHIASSLNAAELARRQFREIARVAGLIFQGYPGEGRSSKHLQASSGLIYDVFCEHDPENMLLQQARREVLEKQLEHSRLRAALERLERGSISVVDVARPTPLAFPILVDRLRESLSSESLVDRIEKMQLVLEAAAG